MLQWQFTKLNQSEEATRMGVR